MRNFTLSLENGKKIKVCEGTLLYEVAKNDEGNLPVILAKLNENVYELNHKVTENGVLKFIHIDNNIGMRAYIRTLQFVLIKSVLDIFPESKITIEHSLSKGLYCEITKDVKISSKDTQKIKKRMEEIINKDIPIKKVYMSREDARDIFENYKMDDKVRLLNHLKYEQVELYELDGRFDYFYGDMAYSTGILKKFDVMYYEPGLILRFPTGNNYNVINKFVDHKKLAKIFKETEEWGYILDVPDVGALNDKVDNREIIDIIRVAEALHEKKIAYIADMVSERKDVKMILIAGPSSSGKTTFSKRLGIQLRVNGLIPVYLGMDDYFIDRDYTPRDEDGNYNFESIYALDLKLLNDHLTQILKGKEVEIPRYNFKTGKREWVDEKIKLPSNGVLIVEGIHGLNDMLTSAIPKENKFKIYISALTQLNLDNHNRIATTDVRIIRRIVRDYLSRGYIGEETLKMWPSIKRGEEKNIFVFQENADVMFNSTLVYELCVLKKFALKELSKISPNSPVYYEALRLKSFLHFLKDVDFSYVPENSILREFIGGSCFYKY